MNNLFLLGKNNREIEENLEKIARQLDLPEAMFDKVEERYQNISKHLERRESIVATYKPHIYVHGSFALGTMIRPSDDSDEFDIDCICELDCTTDTVTQKNVKDSVGHEIKSYVSSQAFKKDVVEWEKCWTMEYSDSTYTFKVDFVPAIPEISRRFVNSNAHTGIKITDRKHPQYSNIHPNWPISNPKGYANWFKERMSVRLNEMKRSIIANASYAMDAEDIPDYKVKTPLQMSVQLLKRHRDIYFKDKNHKPASIIITTLAAKAYENDSSLIDSMNKIISGMKNFIESRNGVYWIPNPVNSSENLANSWFDVRIRDSFYQWLTKLEKDWKTTYSMEMVMANSVFSEQYGSNLTQRILGTHTSNEYPLAINFDVPQRKKPLWPVLSQNWVNIEAAYSANATTGSWISFQSNCSPLAKGLSLRFSASTNSPSPYDVYWQVVNTGKEATLANQLRGDFHKATSFGAGGLKSTTVKAMRDEHTQYKGTHWVECFIIKNGTCIARSSPFIVNIQ